MNRFAKNIRKIVLKSLSIVIAAMLIVPTLPAMTAAAAAGDVTGNPAFRAIAYDTTVRVEMPYISGAATYRVYISANRDADMAALTGDSAKNAVFSNGQYTPAAYVSGGDTDALSAGTISILPDTTYYFYFVTSNGVTDTLQSTAEVKTQASLKAWTDPGNFDTSWYDGSTAAGKTYSISSPAQLAGLAVLVNQGKTFEGQTVCLEASVDISDFAWTAIGNSSRTFSGTFDGQNHVVKGMYLHAADDCQGLFGRLSGTLKNLGVADGYVIASDTGLYNVGGVVGNAVDSSLIRNCYSTVSVQARGANNAFFGGIVGGADSGSLIQNCYNTGSVAATGSDSLGLGGIAGNSNSTIEDCYNTGSVTAAGNYSSSIGGIAGRGNTVLRSYNTGSVTLSGSGNCWYAGGIIGYDGTAEATIQDCYNTGSISAAGGIPVIGGIIGLAQSSVHLQNCYNLGSVSDPNGSSVGALAGDSSHTVIKNSYAACSATSIGGQTSQKIFYDSNSSSGTFSTAAECLSKTGSPDFCAAPSLYAGGVFSSGNPVNKGYPVLKAFGYTGVDTSIDTEIPNDGTTYTIHNLYQLDLVRNYYSDPSKTFLLAGNIDISPAGYNQQQNTAGSWRPYSTSSAYPFQPTFNGGGFSISGIYINVDYQCESLIGCITGTVKNVGVSGGFVSKGLYTAGVVAYNNGGSVINCYNLATVVSSDLCTGGVVGGGTASYCYNAGAVASSYNYAGGVVGFGSATACYNLGKVTSTSTDAGGVIGQGDAAGCYNSGFVSGLSYVGGVTGSGNVTNGSNSGSVTAIGSGSQYIGGVTGSGNVTNGSNSGAVTAAGTTTAYIGGIAGGSNGSVSNSYNTGIVAGTSCVGGVVGQKSGGSVSYCYSIGTVSATSYAGGIVGYRTGGTTVSGAYYIGCAAGVGSGSSTGTMPFSALAASSIKAGGTTVVTEQNALNADANWKTALGTDFAISYSGYTATPASCTSISGSTITGTAPGSAQISGSFAITQNRLTAGGFSGPTQTFSVSVLPGTLTVTQATPTVTVSPISSPTVGVPITLTATVSGGYHPTGTITFKNNGSAFTGSQVTLSDSDNGVATLSYTPTATGSLSITAGYDGDTNNAAANSTAATATVSKWQPALTLTASPASPGTYPNQFTLTATLSNVYPSASGQAVRITVGGSNFDRTTDATGAVSCTISPSSAATYSATASFAGDGYNKSAASGTVLYEVVKSPQTAPSIGLSGGSESVTYGFSDAHYKATASGGESSGNYFFRSSDPSVVSVNSATGALTVAGKGSATIYVKRLGDTNYNDSAEAGVSVTVAPQTLNAAITPADKVYDGSSSAAVQSILLTGRIGSDDVFLAGSTLAFCDKAAGDGKTVTASGYTLGGTKAANYTLGTVTVGTAGISKAPLSVTDTSVSDKTYDGTASASFTAAPSLSGLVPGDRVTLSCGTPAFADKNASAAPIAVTFTAFGISGPDAANYTLAQPSPATANISKKTLSVSVSPVTIERGQAIPPLSVSISGFAAGETAASLTGFAAPAASQSYGSTATPVKDAPLSVTFSGGNATGNYEFACQNSTTLTIRGGAGSTVSILPAEIENNAPSASLQGPSTEIGQSSLTDADRAALTAGSDISIYLKVKKLDAAPADQAAVQSALAGRTMGQYLDVSLIKNTDGTETNITRTSSPLRITLAVPESLAGNGRVFSIIRVHDGAAATLPDLDEDPNTITMETDRFSTYAIVYTASAPAPAGNPKTADRAPILPFAVTGFVSLAAALTVKKRRYKIAAKEN